MGYITRTINNWLYRIYDRIMIFLEKRKPISGYNISQEVADNIKDVEQRAREQDAILEEERRKKKAFEAESEKDMDEGIAEMEKEMEAFKKQHRPKPEPVSSNYRPEDNDNDDDVGYTTPMPKTDIFEPEIIPDPGSFTTDSKSIRQSGIAQIQVGGKNSTQVQIANLKL